MELGEKLRLTRLEAGLSQRALCGDEITRNMLSRIENGAARPSMKTLGCLAARLGKPVSYFLEEDTVCSPNQEIMTAVRQLFDGKDYAGAMRALAQYRAPDEIYDRERQLLEILVRLSLAEEAISDGREPYALELLETVADLGKSAVYYSADLEQRRLLLLGCIPGQVVNLPGLDEALTVQATPIFWTGRKTAPPPAGTSSGGNATWRWKNSRKRQNAYSPPRGSTTSSGSWRSATGKWAITKTPTFMPAVRRTRNNEKTPCR